MSRATRMKNRYAFSRGNGVYQDVSLCLGSHELLRIVSLVIGEIHASRMRITLYAIGYILRSIVEIDHSCFEENNE